VSGGGSSSGSQSQTTASQSATNNLLNKMKKEFPAIGDPASYLNMFPMGFNLSELTASLSKRASNASNTFDATQSHSQKVDRATENVPATNFGQLSASLSAAIDNPQIQIPSLIALAASTSANSGSQASTPSDLLVETAAEKSVIAQTLSLINNLQLELVNNESNNNNNNTSESSPSSAANFIKLENETANSNSSSTSFTSNSNADELTVLLESLTSNGAILADEILSFDLQTPNLLPNFFGHYLSETASRVLFLTVHWIKRIYVFQFLNDDLKLALLRRAWAELFLLGIAQSSHNLSISTIFVTIINCVKSQILQEKYSSTKFRKISEHILMLRHFCAADLDEAEFAYLRIMSLFNADDIQDKSVRDKLQKIQELAALELRGYLESKRPATEGASEVDSQRHLNERCTRFFLKLVSLRGFDKEIVEELFFNNLVGAMQIDKILPFILQMNSGSAGNNNNNDGAVSL
jgi:Ligand-binding domain of nuclear hormone receptor